MHCRLADWTALSISPPDSPEIQPKFVKGSKRYGRRSTPEFIEPVPGLSEVRNANPEEEEVREDNYDSAVPRKREVKGPRQDPDGQTPSLSPARSRAFVPSLRLAVSCYPELISLAECSVDPANEALERGRRVGCNRLHDASVLI